MSTALPLRVVPSGATGISCSCTGGEWTWNEGAWVQAIASAAGAIAVAELHVAASGAGLWFDVILGVGGAGAETEIGRIKVAGDPAAAAYVFAVPIAVATAADRVALRLGAYTSCSATVHLAYYQDLDSDHVARAPTTLARTHTANAHATASVVMAATAWNDSSWYELLASAANEIAIEGLAVAHTAAVPATCDLEWEVGVGGAGAESVIGTYRIAYQDTGLGTIRVGPAYPYPVVAGTRIAVRLRASINTTGQAIPVNLTYLTPVSLLCSYTVDPTAFAVSYAAQTGLEVDVDASGESCEWTAVSNDGWITITDSPPGATGDGTATFSVTENPAGTARVGTLTIAGETVTVTQAAHPLYSPCPVVDLATTLCGIAEYIWWAEWANWHPGGGISHYGCIDLADPVGYFGGYKPGKGLHCSSAARAMSGLDGAYEGGYFSVTLADHDRAIRHILRTSAPWGRSARGDGVVVRLISDAGRRALAEPAVIAHGVVEGTEFGPDLSVTLRVRDGMAMAGYDGLVPLRLITLADFPNCPADTVGKRVPIVYGTLSDAAEDQPVGMYQPIYVGMLDKAGLAHHTWLVAGHAVTGIDEGYVDGVPITWGVGWLAPGYFGYDVLEAEVYVDINDHRYTLLYAVGAEADEVAAGTKTLRINLRGVEDEADGSGVLIDSYPRQVAHALQNWIIKPANFELYETGLWHIPKWLSTDFGEGPCVVAVDTFETLASGSPPTQTGGGFVIGSSGETEDAKQVISRLALNGGFHIGLNARWQVVGYQVDLTTPTANLPLLDELLDDLTAIEIDEEAFADLHATNARYQRTRRLGSLPSLSEGSPASPIPIQEWLATAVRRDATGADEYGDIPTELALDAVADDTWAQTVCDYWLRLRRHPPRVVRVTGPLCLYSTYDVGDAVQMRHDLLVTETPGDVMRGVVHRVVIDPMRGTCRLDLWDLTDTFEDGA